MKKLHADKIENGTKGEKQNHLCHKVFVVTNLSFADKGVGFERRVLRLEFALMRLHPRYISVFGREAAHFRTASVLPFCSGRDINVNLYSSNTKGKRMDHSNMNNRAVLT